MVIVPEFTTGFGITHFPPWQTALTGAGGTHDPELVVAVDVAELVVAEFLIEEELAAVVDMIAAVVEVVVVVQSLVQRDSFANGQKKKFASR